MAAARLLMEIVLACGLEITFSIIINVGALMPLMEKASLIMLFC